MMNYSEAEITPGKKGGKWRFQKTQGQISLDDDTDITIPNYF